VRRLAALGLVPVACTLMLAACGSSQAQAPGTITVRSAAFAPGGTIPRLYTCDGRDISPPLKWSAIPGDATQLMLVMKDLDAPGGDFIHWQMSELSPRSSGLGAGEAPAVGIAGTNSFGTTGYRGPCPPRGDKPHHYVITVTALGDARSLAIGTLSGTYARG
jgi:Raf kinase inhibitor-like YbhB/YbcL family protein